MRVTLWSPPAAAGSELAAVGTVLERQGCRLAAAATAREVERKIAAHSVDLIVARLTSGFREPLELLAGGRRHLPPVVVVTTGNEVDLYLEAMRAGAFDGVGLPVDEKELLRISLCAVEELHAPMTR